MGPLRGDAQDAMRSSAKHLCSPRKTKTGTLAGYGTHAPNPEEMVQLRARSSVRSAAAASSCERVQNLVGETVETVPVCDHVALNEQGLRRPAHASRKRIRQELEDQPGNHLSLQTLVIPQSLLHDRGTICCLQIQNLGRIGSLPLVLSAISPFCSKRLSFRQMVLSR